MFILMQLVGGLLSFGLIRLLYPAAAALAGEVAAGPAETARPTPRAS
jgi:hypothetical protein